VDRARGAEGRLDPGEDVGQGHLARLDVRRPFWRRRVTRFARSAKPR
jgi:hypothetical protein